MKHEYKPTLTGWIVNGKSMTDRQAAIRFASEIHSFSVALRKHLQLDQCRCCAKWGRLENDIFILGPGEEPICLDAECVAKVMHDDYTSHQIVSLAILRRKRKMSDSAWSEVFGIEPIATEIRAHFDLKEIPLGHERESVRFDQKFAEMVQKIDSAMCVEEVK